MLRINTGGPAFPRPGFYPDMSAIHGDDFNKANGSVTHPEDGMTLRDWFAGQAVQMLRVEEGSFGWGGKSRREIYADIALAAYDLADALLVARALPHDIPGPLPRPAARGPRDGQQPGEVPRPKDS